MYYHGMFTSVNGVHSEFLEYDDELSGLVAAASGINIEGSGESPTISYTVKPRIETLSGSTSYTLDDAKIYRTTLIADTDFILPSISETDVLHEIILTCKFNGNSWYATFKDTSNNPISTMDGNNNFWSDGDVVQYLCRYEPFLEKWVVMPMKLY